jgi:hypothetical protein
MKLSVLALAGWLALATAAAQATGTILIQQSSGESNTYDNVAIKILHGSLYLTTADGRGTLVITRAACSHQDQLMVCFATNATLVQSGQTSPLDFDRGTIYINNTDSQQPLVLSTAKVPAHGILVSLTTKRGTYIGLSGRIDKVTQP